MGGDDLDSDDEFLNPSIHDTAGERLREKIEREEVVVEKKRKRDDEDEDADDKVAATPSKSSTKVLLEAGRDLERQPTDVQGAFLTMSLKHYVQMKGESVEGLMNIHPSAFVTSNECSLEARLRSVVTKKKLKGWKPIGSPMVVVVCISARRAVAVLKELYGTKQN